MAEHASNYDSGTKRKSEEGERNSRAKRNRYISIAWSVMHGRAIVADANISRPSVTSAKEERSRYLAIPSPPLQLLLTSNSAMARQATQTQ
jgi:hypothetical protein